MKPLTDYSIEVLFGQIQACKKKLALKTHEHIRSDVESYLDKLEKAFQFKWDNRKVRY